MKLLAALLQELDGRSALNWIAEQPELPDLVLLDCMMPGMDGKQLYGSWRKPGCTLPQAPADVLCDPQDAKGSAE